WLSRKCILYPKARLRSRQRRHSFFTAVVGDRCVPSRSRIAMHDHAPAGNVQHPVFDDARPSIKDGFRSEVETERRIRDFDYQLQVSRTRVFTREMGEVSIQY